MRAGVAAAEPERNRARSTCLHYSDPVGFLQGPRIDWRSLKEGAGGAEPVREIRLAISISCRWSGGRGAHLASHPPSPRRRSLAGNSQKSRLQLASRWFEGKLHYEEYIGRLRLIDWSSQRASAPATEFCRQRTMRTSVSLGELRASGTGQAVGQSFQREMMPARNWRRF